MVYTLMIDKANDAAFSFVALLYFIAGFAALIIITAIAEQIGEAVERKRRKKYRNNYVRLK